ncbi:HupE/UreJ family protein [Marinomonas gallaica]|uniref:HupE/UreJ family protein n=1 Tax=Marinomonas gallaica TaxID=1806667 RepID=UPI00083026CF|nr:HupE/UreJ family protein [Marinomonas gallaica]
MRITVEKTGLLALTLIPGMALAHPGHEHTSSFLSGLIHPLTGLDHLLAMFAIGLWATSLGGRSLTLVPTMFVTVMLLGAGAAMLGMNVPFIESGILLSVILMGALLLSAKRLPLAASITIAGTFAIFHGAAHGMEMPLNANGFEYGLGFALATIALHLVGIGTGRMLQSLNLTRLNQVGGAAISLAGVFLVFA